MIVVDTAVIPRDVALVAGCFDPLHPGHLRYLDAAAAFGPVCCAVATDAQIQRMKHRPALQSQEARMTLVDALPSVAYVIAQDDSGDAGVLEDVRPAYYVKGHDWLDRLPEAETKACAQFGIPAVFLEAGDEDSSSELLRSHHEHVDRDAAMRFELAVLTQPTPIPWEPVTPYDFETRKAIEGRQPTLIKDTFAPQRVLDYGAGFGHLIRLLQELGVEAEGWDPYPRSPSLADWLNVDERAGHYDLVICREVLEHCTLREIRDIVTDLTILSSRYIYITTRFNMTPEHLLHVVDHDDLDPTHISLCTKSFYHLLFALEGFQRRPALERQMDWQFKGRCLVFEKFQT